MGRKVCGVVGLCVPPAEDAFQKREGWVERGEVWLLASPKLEYDESWHRACFACCLLLVGTPSAWCC